MSVRAGAYAEFQGAVYGCALDELRHSALDLVRRALSPHPHPTPDAPR